MKRRQYIVSLPLLGSAGCLRRTRDYRDNSTSHTELPTSSTSFHISWDRPFSSAEQDYRLDDITQGHDGGIAGVGTRGDYTWLLKTDRRGHKEWETVIDTNRRPGQFHVITQAADNEYLIGGVKKEAGTRFDRSIGGWIARIDDEGKEIWARTFEPGKDGSFYSVQTLHRVAEDEYIATGRRESYKSRRDSVWVLRFDGEGTQLWQRFYGANVSSHTALVRDESSYLLGGSSGAPEGAWLSSIDDGMIKWQVLLGRNNLTGFLDLSGLPNGGVMAVGSFDDGEETYPFVAQIGSDGKPTYQSYYGEHSDGRFTTITQMGHGYIITGSTSDDESGLLRLAPDGEQLGYSVLEGEITSLWPVSATEVILAVKRESRARLVMMSE